MEDLLNLHMGCKWFVGLRPWQAAPDRSTLSRLNRRLGPEKRRAILDAVRTQASQAGLALERKRGTAKEPLGRRGDDHDARLA